MAVAELLERIERVTAAVQGPARIPRDPFPLDSFIGITITVLSVLLAFCGAKAGAERAELTRVLLEQSSARAEFHAQDVKHRAAVIALQQLRATLPFTADADRRRDVMQLVSTAERYLAESQQAGTWASSFDRLVDARVHGQEGFETAHSCFEIGMALAALALLMRRRVPWIAAIALGLVAVAVMVVTDSRTNLRVHEAAQVVDRTSRDYARLRHRDRTTNLEQLLIADLRSWASVDR